MDNTKLPGSCMEKCSLYTMEGGTLNIRSLSFSIVCQLIYSTNKSHYIEYL